MINSKIIHFENQQIVIKAKRAKIRTWPQSMTAN